MTTDALLIEKREEFKRKLAAGEYKTLVDVFLEWFDRLLRKPLRRTKPLPLWFITMILCLASAIIVNATIYFAGDWATFLQNGAYFGFGYKVGFLINFLNGFIIIITIILVNQSIRRFFTLWQEYILENTEQLKDMTLFEDWVNNCCNKRLHLLVIAIATISALFITFSMDRSLQNLDMSGYGIKFSNLVNDVFLSVIFYQFMMVILLSAGLRNFNLKLFAADPGSSEVISRLSGELGFFGYLTAIFGAIFSFWSARLGLFASSLGFTIIISWWLFIIALFILNQTSLASIIRRAKWKTLNEIQAQVEELRATNSLKDKETIDAINRLMDYHDRVKATRNSAIDSRTILNFINSLLLPLLAFFLGNLDNLLVLFRKSP